MSNPVLSQLASVESDLSQQVDSLSAQLAAIQEQRAGLHTVIEIFKGGAVKGRRLSQAATPVTTISAANAAKTSQSLKVDKASARKPSEQRVGRSPGRSAARSAAKKATSSKVIAPAETAAKTAAKTASKTPSKTVAKTVSKTAKKAARKKQKDGRAAEWQAYAQPNYKDDALPEVVSIVLRSQPSEVFKIADVMSSIFVEDMPREDYLKARNRISNILSAGVRNGIWYRGRNGRYAQTESAIKSR